MKTKLLLFLVAIFSQFFVQTVIAEEFIDNNIKYSITSDNTVEVISNNYSGDVNIPQTVVYNAVN